MAEITLTTTLPCHPDKVWARVQTSALLLHVAFPMIRFTPLNGTRLPRVWKPGEYRVRMWLLGFIPVGWQAVVISTPAPEGERRFIRDNGYGPLVRRWDHLITIAPGERGTTIYTDRVIIEAGLLTPVVAMFAELFYAFRQRRWRELTTSDFRALKS